MSKPVTIFKHVFTVEICSILDKESICALSSDSATDILSSILSYEGVPAQWVESKLVDADGPTGDTLVLNTDLEVETYEEFVDSTKHVRRHILDEIAESEERLTRAKLALKALEGI